MELKKRIELLTQTAKLAQQNGVLSLDDAVIVKKAIDVVNDGTNVKEGLNVLIKIANLCQKKGILSLKDAFYVYLAIDGIDNEFESEDSKDETEKGEE